MLLQSNSTASDLITNFVSVLEIPNISNNAVQENLQKPTTTTTTPTYRQAYNNNNNTNLQTLSISVDLTILQTPYNSVNLTTYRSLICDPWNG